MANEKGRQPDIIVGLAVLGGTISGSVSVIAAIFPFCSGGFTAAGLCLIAAALAFGLVANALLRE